METSIKYSSETETKPVKAPPSTTPKKDPNPLKIPKRMPSGPPPAKA